MTLSFGNVSNEYAQYRDRLPELFYQQLMDHGVDFHGLEVVDLGSGTGLLARDLAKRGACVVGIEPSRELIEHAERLGQSEQVTVHYVEDTAERFKLGRTYPIFTALRAWHWFERERVLRNVRSHMEANGLLVIIHAAFLPDSEVAQRTFHVLRNNGIQLKPAGAFADAKERRCGFPVAWFEEWERYSFQVNAEWQQDYSLEYTHEAWCGKIRSVSWLADLNQSLRERISDELLVGLQLFEPKLEVPHRYSVVLLKAI